MPRPVAPANRIEALDVLRGLAIFGILVVNVEQMFLPMLIANDPVPMIPGERGALAAWAFTDALFESKYLTLFSLLFGIGFCLQFLRAEDARSFRRLYLRRIAVLILFGVLHGVFFYKADVLVIYGVTALILMPLRRLTARSLGWAGAGLLLVTIVWNAVIGGPDDPEEIVRKRQVATEIAAIRDSGSIALPAELVSSGDGRDTPAAEADDVVFPLPMPASPAVLGLDSGDELVQAKVEYAVFSHGPPAAAIASRIDFLALLLLLYTPIYLLWRTLALFLIGAAVVKSGLLDPERRATWRWTTRLGLGLGLPTTLVATALHLRHFADQGSIFYLIGPLHDVSSLLIAGGLAAGVFLACTSDRLRAARRAFAAVGRTALTNYIGQSVAMSLVATSYGLGLFGDVTRVQILLLAVVCFALQVAASTLWLRWFRMGPLEWAWRSLTYWKPAPLGRG